MTPDELQDHLSFAMRVQSLRAVYHQAIGETILLRLAFTDAPQFETTEHFHARTVTLRREDREGVLTLHADSPHDQRACAIRDWIASQVDLARLTPSKHHSSSVHYRRQHQDRRRI